MKDWNTIISKSWIRLLESKKKSKQKNPIRIGKILKKYCYIRTITIDDRKKKFAFYLILYMMNKILLSVQCKIDIWIAILSGNDESFIVWVIMFSSLLYKIDLQVEIYSLTNLTNIFDRGYLVTVLWINHPKCFVGIYQLGFSMPNLKACLINVPDR